MRKQDWSNYRYKDAAINTNSQIHFTSFAVVERVDVFTRKHYRDIVVDSLRSCQNEKGMLRYAWCIMSNHLHLMAAAKENNLSDIHRDFKKFTSKQIIAAVQNKGQQSRKEWRLPIFRQANSRNSQYQFWRQDNRQKNVIVPHSPLKN